MSCCSKTVQANSTPFTTARYAILLLASLVAWFAAYSLLIPFSEWIAHGLLGLRKGTSLGDATAFFFYDTPKILMLLVLMVYIISWLRAGVNVERIRNFLSGKTKGFGYVLASIFGAVSPFCSCSTIPLFLGFISARIPIGITMAFLITSPIINEVAVVLLFGLLGWKYAVTYVAVGMLAGIIGGIIMDVLQAERWLQPMFRMTPLTMVPHGDKHQYSLSLKERHAFAISEVKSIFRKVWVWVVLGVTLGAGLHGYVPQNWFAEHLGAGQWWTVPFAVGAGIPLYTNATGIVPVMESLLAKGLPIGTTLAFCISSVATSLPEFMMLKQVMTWKLIVLFIVMLLIMFTLAGWFLNIAQAFIF
ncbi:MAG: permease [Desulfovibrio sp.]|nr:permease [Desulfovibrio sp.]